MLGTALTMGTTLGLVALGAGEWAWHRRNLSAIPIRVHVNGTRGKSSVTRLIAAGLRHAGVITCAKTTGTLARMILPDGRELPITRTTRPNVAEQVRVVAMARDLGAQALVLECMALRPALQWLCEHKLVRATHGVLTNVRPDHLDVMGPHESDVARALCGMVPPGGQMYTAEVRWRGIVEMACADRGTTLLAVTPEESAGVDAAVLARFRYTEHPENVALALRVLHGLGVPRETALSGMANADADPGALMEYSLDFFGRKLVFVNGFAANDPVSTGKIWAEMAAKHAALGRRIAIFNCRDDRLDRSVQLGQAMVHWPAPDHIVLMGSGAYIFARAAVRAGLDASKLVFVGDAQPAETFEAVVGLVDEAGFIMGLGNIGGHGLGLVQYFRNRARRAQPARSFR
jgi:poly-gamma-glutamate synthase PgsB/CapB